MVGWHDGWKATLVERSPPSQLQYLRALFRPSPYQSQVCQRNERAATARAHLAQFLLGRPLARLSRHLAGPACGLPSSSKRLCKAPSLQVSEVVCVRGIASTLCHPSSRGCAYDGPGQRTSLSNMRRPSGKDVASRLYDLTKPHFRLNSDGCPAPSRTFQLVSTVQSAHIQGVWGFWTRSHKIAHSWVTTWTLRV